MGLEGTMPYSALLITGHEAGFIQDLNCCLAVEGKLG